MVMAYCRIASVCTPGGELTPHLCMYPAQVTSPSPRPQVETASMIVCSVWASCFLSCLPKSLALKWKLHVAQLADEGSWSYDLVLSTCICLCSVLTLAGALCILPQMFSLVYEKDTHQV